jgi:hypothetical protein
VCVLRSKGVLKMLLDVLRKQIISIAIRVGKGNTGGVTGVV